MILRPVRPASPWGPPTTNLPVGFTRKRVAAVAPTASRLGWSARSAVAGSTTWVQRSAAIRSRIAFSSDTPSISAVCWVEIRIVSIATGRSLS